MNLPPGLSYHFVMQIEASQLAGFYESARGQAVRRAILHRLMLTWPYLKNLRLLGYGFAMPYLKSALGEAERVVALMPAQMGVLAWPRTRPLTVLGEESALPFTDAVFDRILVVHGLEGAESVRVLLRQLWRVLAPEGRLLIVAPNRTSLWAQVEASPFASGRPFRKGELDRLLRDTLFEPLIWDTALYIPPFGGGRLGRMERGWERMGRRLLPGLAGVHLVEAKKTLYGITPVRRLKQGEAQFVGA